MAFQLRRIQVALCKVEATEGVDATPGAADALRLAAPGAWGAGAEVVNERPDLHNQLLDESGDIEPSAKYAEFTGRIHLRGIGGSGYTATTIVSEMHALNQGAGFSAALAGGVWSFDTASVATKSLTFKLWGGLDTGVHVLHTILGARLSRLAFIFRVGQLVDVEFTARGIYVAPTDTAVIAPSYLAPTVSGPRFLAATSWSLGSLANPLVREASVVIENTLTPRLGANVAGDGLAGYAITARRSSFSAKFEAQRIADINAYNEWVNATYAALAIDVPGTGGITGNKFHVDADKAVITAAPAYEDQGGLVLQGVTGKLTPDGATNRVKISAD